MTNPMVYKGFIHFSTVSVCTEEIKMYIFLYSTCIVRQFISILFNSKFCKKKKTGFCLAGRICFI